MKESQELLNILNHYDLNTWDAQGGTDKATYHTYTGPYELILNPFKDKECNILEIGCWQGGSALLWQKYLPKSNLVLIDIEYNLIEKIKTHLDETRYEFIKADAYMQDTFETIKNKFFNGFDIIIDDGPHTYESQLYCIEKYLHLLKKGGTMIIEDIISMDNANSLFNYIPDEYKNTSEIINLTHIKNRSDDILIKIHKP